MERKMILAVCLVVDGGEENLEEAMD